jgi:hypothetical protein
LRTRRAGSAVAALALVALPALAGCGGGGGGSSGSSHTYVVQAPASNALAKGIYVTIVSPVPIPTKLLTRSGGKLVSKAQGPQKCSYTKTVPAACKALEKAPLNAAHLAGG